MKISIIIPIYKVEAYIVRNLESIIRQTYLDIEVILIDDASPDRSIELAKKVINNSNRKQIFKIITHQQNLGLSAARNTGIRAATGDYIYFIDSDDELADINAISILVDIAQQKNADIVIGNYVRIFPTYSQPSIFNKRLSLSKESLIDAFTKGLIPITAWNKLLKKEWLLQNNLQFKEGIVTEDELFAYQSFFANPRIELSGTITYNYIIRNDSISASFNLTRIKDSLYVYENIIHSYKNANSITSNNDPRIANCLDRIAFNHYLEIYQSQLSIPIKKELYKRLQETQKSFIGFGKLRYFYTGHIYIPSLLGFHVMKAISKFYLKFKKTK